jgi:two-component system, OmpR family, sensor kinase
MSGTVTQRHLRRLRWSLTALFSATTLVALAVLVAVASGIDSDLRWSAMGERLLDRANAASATVYFDEEGRAIGDRFLSDDGLTGDWPQVWVFEVVDGDVLALVGPDADWYGVDPADAARRVALDGVDYTDWVGSTEDGADIHGRGVPIVEPRTGDVAAIALAVAAYDDFFADHQTFRTRLILAAVALTGLAAWAGFWLAGRGTTATALALAQQERLLSDAAHELRTPIARLRAVAESGVAGDEPPAVALERVARLSDDAGRMVDDMLTLARMEAGREPLETTPLRLDLLVEEVASEYEGVEISSVETVVEGDVGLLRRAVSNLVRNAVVHGEAPVKVTVYPKRLIVSDRGPGIPDEEIGQVFERFRTGAESQGHGLGLPIVAWIVEAHGGSVDVANRTGGGLEATLEL